MTASIHREGTIATPSDLEITMQRVFQADAATLFDIWTKPEHVRKWYGVRGTTVTVCEIDLRVGGAWRWVVAKPDGFEVAFSGVFTEIERPARFQRTEIFEMVGPPGAVVTVSFDEKDGATTVTMNMLFEDKAGRDMCLLSGMELGVQETYLNIDRLVEEMR